MKHRPYLLALLMLSAGMGGRAMAASACDRECLERIGADYREAYRTRDPSRAPISPKVRFVENNVAMPFPDGSWHTVTKETGQPMVLSDPKTGQVGIYTAVLQNDTETYVAVRLAVKRGQIVEIEQVLSTKRNLSSPPTPIGDIAAFRRDPSFPELVPQGERASREALVRHANGYFDTLQFNNGEIRGTRFAPGATRNENGMRFDNIEQGFKSGRYRFNNRVRDRDCFLVDEARSAVMCRGYIDHKGVLDQYRLTDGTVTRSVYREPHTWAFFEAFKVRGDAITAVEATFTGAPYYIRSPFVKKADPVYDKLAGDNGGM
jgi:hypothetical protein